MKPNSLPSYDLPLKNYLFILLFIVLLLLFTSSCNILFGSDTADLEKTQTALSNQQTELAEQSAQDLDATIAAQQATIDAQSQPPSPDMAGTMEALSATQTAAAGGGAPPVVTQPPPIQTQPPQPPSGDFETMMKSAKIVVYEDIVNDPTEYHYVERTLKGMGLPHKWDGSAKGWFKTDLLSGAPGGGPWDLVILAVEVRGEVSGEYFEYINNVLNQGTSVIIEAWHLDSISAGTVSTILTRCGVMVYEYFPKTGTINDVLVWPLMGASSHPLLSQPNTGLSFTRARDKWLYSGDLGDLMALTGSGDAQLLMGTNAQDNTRDGVLATCLGGQLTLMTFSSHSFPYEVMYPLWENMIYNALKIRLTGAY